MRICWYKEGTCLAVEKTSKEVWTRFPRSRGTICEGVGEVGGRRVAVHARLVCKVSVHFEEIVRRLHLVSVLHGGQDRSGNMVDASIRGVPQEDAVYV